MKIRSIFRFTVMVSLVLAVFAGSFALANTETSDVVTNVFEPVPANWFFAGLNGVEGVTVNVPTEDGFISGPIEFKCELNEENWQKAFNQSSSTEEVRWPVGIVIPKEKNAIAASSMGTGFSNEDSVAMNYINSNDYYDIDDNRRVEQSIELATVAYGDSYMVIAPKTWQRAYLFKWKDDQDVEHFHRINIKWTHKAPDVAVSIPFAVPSNERIVMNYTGHGGISAEYDDGTVVYLVEKPQELNTAVTTGIYPPNGIDAAYVSVELQSGGSGFYSVGANTPALLSISADAEDRSEDTFRLEWMDEQRNILEREVIAIQALPKWNGTWMGKYWAPVEQNPVKDINVGSYLSYEDGILTFSVDSNNMDGLNPEELCEKREYWYISVPDGATHFKYSGQHIPLYGGNFAESTKKFFEINTDYIAVQDAKGGDLPFRYVADQGCLAVSFGPIFKKASLKDQENLTIYIVDDSLAGYADMLHIQWYGYDKTYKLIQSELNGKNGEYICMVKEPAISEEKVLSQEPSGPVLNATAVIKDPNSPYHKATLRCEIPVQQQNGGDYILSYMKLTLHDEAGNEINLQPGTKMTIYIPYPEGITHQTAQNYDFSVRHYLDDNHNSYETIKVRREGIKGLAFDTTSFSPFLIMCEPTFSNSGTSGISVTYNGGNSFSTSNSAVPTSVEIDGVPVSFTGDGRSFTVSGIPAGAKWITVRWNSTSITTNFAPDGNVVSAGIEIPKTGDISLLMPVLALIGAAAARCRRSSK